MKLPFNKKDSATTFAPVSKYTSTFGKAAAVALVGSLMATAASQAVLRITFNLRPVLVGLTANSTPGTVVNPDGLNANAAVTVPGGSVVFQLLATLNTVDADLSNDFFIKLNGSFLSSLSTLDAQGGLRGDALTAAGINNTPGFRGTGAKSGLQVSGAGDLSSPQDAVGDVGGTSLTAITNYFVSSSDTPSGTAGQTFVLGETVLTLASGSTTVNFRPRTVANSGAAANRLNVSFKLDGVSFNLNGDGSTTATNVPDPTAFIFNGGTLIAVPEPSAFGMVILGAMGLVGFRRLGLRRS